MNAAAHFSSGCYHVPVPLIGWSRKTDLEWEDRFSAGVYRL